MAKLYFSAIIILLIGILIFVNALVKKSHKSVLCSGILLIVGSVAGLTLAIFKAELAFICTLTFAIGLAFLVSGAGKILLIIHCDKKIPAIYCGSKTIESEDAATQYIPYYSYTYNGKYYKGHPTEQVLKDLFVGTVGFKNEIYINPKKPEQFLVMRFPEVMEIMYIITGIIMISSTICIICFILC